MSTVILSGTTLLEYVQQAQNICGTDFPIIGLNRQYHIEPSKTFNSLPHTEVDIIPLWALFSPFAFQLTTSHRGRHIFLNIIIWTQIFQLTTSHRGRLNKEHFEEKKMLFQLTTSHRGRQHFRHYQWQLHCISTHYLTQR